MTIEELKNKIELGKHKLPLFIHESDIKELVSDKKSKIVSSSRLKDNNFQIHSFYKPITKFEK